MSAEKKIEIEILIYSVYREKQMCSSEMKGKQRKLGTESHPTTSDKNGNWGGVTVYSIKFTKSSRSRKITL